MPVAAVTSPVLAICASICSVRIPNMLAVTTPLLTIVALEIV